MEKEQYAAGDRVYIKGSYMGRCANVFVTLDRKAPEERYGEGIWFVDYADRSHPVHEKFFEFKSIQPVVGGPRFKRGDRVLVKCPGHATFNQKGTIEELSAANGSGELYDVRLDTGLTHRINLGWLLPSAEVKLPKPKFKVGDTVKDSNEFTSPKVEIVDILDLPDENGRYQYRVREAESDRWVSEHWLKPVTQELPEPKYKKGDKVDYNNGPIHITGTVIGISCIPNEAGEYVYLIQDTDGKKRWSAEVFTTLAKKPDTFKDQLQPGDRVKLKYNRSCGTVVERETDPGFIERYRVKWDKTGKTYTESRRSLEVLHAPRSTDDPLPAQAEIDAIDRMREPLIKQVEELQAKLSVLNQAKAKFKQF